VTRPDVPDRLRQLLIDDGVDRAGPPSADCLDDDLVAALAEGGLDPQMRIAMLPHLAGCARCRAAVASVSQALADPAVAAEVAAVERARPGRLWQIGRIAVPIAVAAVAVLAVVRGPMIHPDVESGHRAPTITSLPAPVPVAPVGQVAAARRLVWTPAVGADRYRITLFDRDGGVLYETELYDTVAAVPDSVVLDFGHPYLWKVEARTGIGRWTSSELVEFSLPARPAP